MVVENKIHHPKHYTQGGIECIDAIRAAVTDKTGFAAVCTANVIKYVWRYQMKNGVEDLYKSRQYLDWLITEEEKNKEQDNGDA